MSKQYLIIGKSPWNTPSPEGDGSFNKLIILEARDKLEWARVTKQSYLEEGFTDLVIMREGALFE